MIQILNFIMILICCLSQTAFTADDYQYPASSPLITINNPENHPVQYYHESFSICHPATGPIIEIDLTGDTENDIRLDTDTAAIGQTIYLEYYQEIRKLIIPDIKTSFQWTELAVIETLPPSVCRYPGSQPAITVIHSSLPALKWYYDPVFIDLPSQGPTISLDLTHDDTPDVQLDCDTAALGKTIHFVIDDQTRSYSILEKTASLPEPPEISLPEQTRQQGIDIQLAETSPLSDMCISNIGFDICQWEPFARNIHWTLKEGAGQKTIYFSFKDSHDQIISQTKTILFMPNHKPLAFQKSYENTTGDPMTFQLKATDEDNDPLTFSIHTPCSKGTLALNPQTGVINYTPIENGTDQFVFVVHDGFIQSYPAAIVITLDFDNTAPVINGLHNDQAPKQQKKWSWSAEDESQPVTYRFQIDQVAHHEQLSGPFSETQTAQISHQTGVFYIHVQAKDNAGHVSEVISVSTILDNTPPDAPILNHADHVQGSVYHFLTNTAFTFDGSKEAQSQIFVNHQEVNTGSFARITWQYAPALIEGIQDFVIYARDSVGNESESIQAIVTLDTIPPEATYSRSPSDTYLTTSTVRMQVNGNDVTHYAYQLDDQARSEEIPINQPLILTNLAASKMPGTPHNLILFVRDLAGNWQELPEDTWYNRIQPLNITGFQYPPHLIYDKNKNLVVLMKDERFTATIQISGGKPPYTYTVSSEYLSLTPASMPTTESVTVWGQFPVCGDRAFSVSVTDAINNESMNTIYVKVMAPLTINPESLPAFTSGQTETIDIQVSGGCGTYSLRVEQPNDLAQQIQLMENILTVEPLQAMSETLWLYARDTCGYTARRQYAVIAKDPLHITSQRLEDGIVQAHYFQQLTVEGGSGDYIWHIDDGIHPKGLALNPQTGEFSGIPQDYVSDTITFSVTDSDGRTTYGSFNLSIVDELTIKTTQMPVFIDKAPYDFNIQTNGGIRPFTFILDGQLPDGLSFDSQTGRISGTVASSAAQYNIDLIVTDSFYPTNQMTWISYTIQTEAEGLQIISPLILPDAQEGQWTEFQFQGVGGMPNYSWNIIDGSLPKGIALNVDTGSLNGIPLQNGTFSFQIQIIDTDGRTDTQDQTWKIVKKLQIVSLSLPNAPKNKWYSTIVKAVGGKKPYVWSVDGALPDGLSLNPKTGTISGTPANSSINLPFTLSVQDSDVPAQQSQKQLKINVTDQLYIYTQNLPQGKKGNYYRADIQAENGESPYEWDILQGDLPLGLDFYVSENKGIIEGTPSQAGDFQMTVQMNDNQYNGPVYKTYTLTVIDDVRIMDQQLFTARRTSDYLFVLTAENGKKPYEWSLIEGRLPEGLQLYSQSDSTFISGTVTPDASDEAFTLKVSDANGTECQWETMISVVDPLRLNMAQMNIHDAVQYFPYQTLFTASDGTKPYKWQINTSLPDGLNYTFSDSQAFVYGVPAACGQAQFDVIVADSSNPVDKKIYTYDLFIACQDDMHPDIDPGPYKTGSLSGRLTFNGMAAANVSVAMNGAAAGVSDANGDYELTSIYPGRYDVSFMHDDYCMRHAQVFIDPDKKADLNVALYKSDGSTLTFQKTDLSLAYENQPYNDAIQVTGGCRPYAFQLCGQTLPEGLVLNTDTGKITGQSQTSGTYHLCIQVTESGGLTITAQTNLHVLADPFQVSNPHLSCAVQNLFYMDQIELENGLPPYKVTITSGTIPAGLSISDDAIISGIFYSQVPVAFELEIADGFNQRITQSFQISVAGPLVIKKQMNTIQGIAGKALDIQLKADGGCGKKTWQLFRSCPHIEIFSETGQLYGIPETSTLCTLVVSVEDAAGHRAYQDFCLDISQELSVVSDQLPPAFQGKSYSEQVIIQGGALPLRFTALDTLPEGLSLDSQTGEIYGWPKKSGDYLFQMAIHDSSTAMPQSLTSVFKLHVQEMLTIVSPVTIPDASYGDQWSFDLTAEGYQGSCQWQLISGELPSGITLNESTGQLIGKIRDSGNYQPGIQVTDDQGNQCQKTFIWTINAPLRFISAYLPDAIQGHAYQKTLDAQGGKKPYYWELTSGNANWPQSLSLNPKTGHISGIPATGMDYRVFRLTVYDQNGASDSQDLGFSIFSADTINITENLPSGIVGKIYNQMIQADIANESLQYPLTWTHNGRFLPGITGTCNAHGCHLTGKPTCAGQFPMVVRITDSGSTPFQMTFDYRLIIKPSLQITTPNLPDAEPGQFYSKAITVTGGTAPYTFSIVSGELPDGLELKSGKIEGTVSTQAKSSECLVQVMDCEFNAIAQKEFTIFVIGDTQPLITTMALRPVAQFDNQEIILEGKGGTKPYTWQLSDGNLPEGIAISDNQLHGFPESCGKYSFSIRLTDHRNQQTLRLYEWIVSCRGDINGDFAVDLPDLISALQMMAGVKMPFDAFGRRVNWKDVLMGWMFTGKQ